MATAKRFTPYFARGTFREVKQSILDGIVKNPAFAFLTDKQCLAYLDVDNKLYLINLDRIEALEAQLDGLVDPTTGETIKVTEYVTEKTEPIATKVEVVSTDVEEIKKNGATILITSDGGDE